MKKCLFLALFLVFFGGPAAFGHFPDSVNNGFIIDIGLSGMGFGLNSGCPEPHFCGSVVNSENGIEKTLFQWCIIYNKPFSNIKKQLKKGKNIDEALGV